MWHSVRRKDRNGSIQAWNKMLTVRKKREGFKSEHTCEMDRMWSHHGLAFGWEGWKRNCVGFYRKMCHW